MFGEPCPRPRDATILPFVCWTYLTKIDLITGATIYKACCTCNGGKRYGKAVTLAETYATCVEQPVCRLYWIMTSSEGYIAMGADPGNAFAEAPPPIQPFYMIIDDQLREWWTEHKKTSTDTCRTCLTSSPRATRPSRSTTFMGTTYPSHTDAGTQRQSHYTREMPI